MNGLKFIAIIPARYASTRFPGKPLAMLGGKSVIERVYGQVAGTVDEVVVATDDQRIYDAVRAFGGEVEMTSAEHRSGTDRCWEAYCRHGHPHDIVINVQGDEPFIQPSQLEEIKRCFDRPGTDIATLVKPFAPSDGLEALENPNSPKVVLDAGMHAMYFSRSFGSRSEICASKSLKSKIENTVCIMSITLRNSAFTWSGRQKMWASSCVNERTRVRPCNSPLFS